MKDPFKPATQIKAEHPEIQASVHTFRRRLCQRGLFARRPAKKPQISKKNRAWRLRWAKEHLGWTVSLFS